MAPYSRDNLAVARLFCYSTAKEVELVRVCYRDQKIRVFYIGLCQSDVGGAVTGYSHSVYSVCQSLDVFIYLVNDCYVVAVVYQMLREVLSNLSASNDNYIHNSSVED